jgi:hypothetical protein
LKANDLDSSSGKAANNLSVSGESETGGIFKAQGEVTLTPFAVSVNTGFRELPAKQILPFFTTSPLLGDLEGNLSGKGQLTLPAAGFSGELQLTGYTNKKQGATALSWQTAVFQDVNYTAEPLHLGIASTKIDQARFSWEITGKDNGPLEHVRDFFQKILTANDRQPSGTTDRASFPVTIRDITFSNGRIDLDDRRLTPNWQAAVVDFAGTISNIDPAAAPGNSPFSMSGKLGASPVTIEGAMDLFAPANNGSFRFSLENYPLAAFQHQLAPKTDIDPGSGRLQLNLDCRWQDRQYIRSGIATLVDVQPVDQTSDSALPLALLSGNDNTFQLPFDFTGTEPIAGTTLLDELLTAFQTLVVKGSVSPLLLAKGDFTDLVDNETIEFNPGEFIMTGSGQELLGRYGAFLTAHPRVGLVLSGGIAPNIDIPAMQQRLTALEQQRVDKENEKLFKIWQEKKALYQQNLSELEKQVGPGGEIVEQDIPADILAGFTPLRPVPVVVDQSMLLELGRKRIDILYQYLTGGLNLPAGRITAEKPDSSADLEDSRTVGVSITLKVFSQ